jgi:MarR family transcriptional regulator, organic hydroperoxide resistance regulator
MKMRAETGVAKKLTRETSRTSKFGLNDRLLSRFFRTANLLASRTTRWLTDQDITSQQWSVLGSLSRPRAGAGMTVNQLSEYLMVSRQNLTVVLDRLDRRGFTIRVPDSSDGRTKRVQLTPKGHQLVAAIVPRLADFYRAALDGFTEDEQRTFMTFVDRLKSNVESC